MSDKPKVVKLAQPGYDVKTAGDENLIYNSNWPLLKTFKSGYYTQDSSIRTPQVIFEHNLGYSPFYWFFSNNDISSWSANFTVIPPTFPRAEFLSNDPSFVMMSDTKMYLQAGGALTGTKLLSYYIFALDLNKPFTAPIIKTGGQTGARQGGKKLKIAKPNKDIHSTRLEDYVVHSDARSPLIHMVQPVTITGTDPNSGTIGTTIYHNLGYVPMYFVFRLFPAGFLGGPLSTGPFWTQLFTGQSGGLLFRVDEQKIIYRDAGVGEQCSFVVLKDPFDISYTVSTTVT